MTNTSATSSPDHRPAECLEVSMPVGSRALIVSDLHLDGRPDPGHVAIIGELAQAIDAWTGPGVVIFAGNTFAAPGGTGSAGAVPVQAALEAHARLTKTVASFAAGPGRRVVLLPGDQDAALAWSGPEQAQLRARLGAELAAAVVLHIDTGGGERRVRVEPGQQMDPLAVRHDLGVPGESPLSQHLRAEVIPAIGERETNGASPRDGWLAGMDRLDDPAAFSRFLASRLVYRKLGRSAWMVLVPALALILLGLPHLIVDNIAGFAHADRVGMLLLAGVAELIVLAGIATVAIRRTWQALSSLSLGEERREPNRNARDLARQLVSEGYAGLVTGHTCRPELAHLGTGFYANTGCAAEVVTEVPSHFSSLGLPPVFLGFRQLSWTEIEAGNELHARLFHTRQLGGSATTIERLLARTPSDIETTKSLQPRLVASYPQGQTWPFQPSGQIRRRRIRRLAGVFVGIAGFISLVSAFGAPIRDRLDALRKIVPLAVPETASALAALAGVGLLVLGRGVRRGQRRAFVVTMVVLLATIVFDLAKGVDVEEALLTACVAVFLWVHRSDFQAKTDSPPLRGALARWAAATAVTVVAATLALEFSVAIVDTSRHRRHLARFSISLVRAVQATTERMVGVYHVSLPNAIDRFFAPAVTTVSVGLGLALCVLCFRPVVARRRDGRSAGTDLARARALVTRYGAGTLDWFALRPDKEFYFWGETVVAYAVYGGVCLVSPDPIGPIPEREPAWRSFRRFVEEHGWALGGLGMGEEWLPIYRATGMHDLYVGDEAVIRTGRFTLDGGRFKGLRQAVNRVAKKGYRISFHDPSILDPGLRAALGDVMNKSRRGDVERGFSMTLGRAFEPEDKGLLLAIVHGPVGDQNGASGGLGPPVAFCQYVPAPGIGGYSLDLMRRDNAEHPNGLIDFAVVETIKYLRDRGGDGLGLNFATMRAVLAGEAGDSLSKRLQAWLMRRMDDSMQIESLWKFNAKFDPDWQPRYAIYDAPENTLAVTIAIARAESWWEIPLIGRFLVPPSDTSEEPSADLEELDAPGSSAAEPI